MSCRSKWSTAFGTRGSRVQILPLRPENHTSNQTLQRLAHLAVPLPGQVPGQVCGLGCLFRDCATAGEVAVHTFVRKMQQADWSCPTIGPYGATRTLTFV